MYFLDKLRKYTFTLKKIRKKKEKKKKRRRRKHAFLHIPK
jgi:hypothetical protein